MPDKLRFCKKHVQILAVPAVAPVLALSSLSSVPKYTWEASTSSELQLQTSTTPSAVLVQA